MWHDLHTSSNLSLILLFVLLLINLLDDRNYLCHKFGYWKLHTLDSGIEILLIKMKLLLQYLWLFIWILILVLVDGLLWKLLRNSIFRFLYSFFNENRYEGFVYELQQNNDEINWPKYKEPCLHSLAVRAFLFWVFDLLLYEH